MDISLSPFAPENLVSRDRFGRPVLRQSVHSRDFSNFGGDVHLCIPRPLLLRRPKVVFFGAQAEKPRFLFLFRRRLVMVFGGQITFSTPQKKNQPRTSACRHITCYFGPRARFINIKTNKKAAEREGGDLKKKKKRPPPTKNGLKKKKSAWAGDQSAFFFFGAPKNRRFSAPKTKIRLFRRAPKEQRPMYTAIRHRASPEFIGSRNFVPTTFTAKSPSALGQ